MAINWQTVRVFISSTFRDMQAERDHLVRFVFPKLRQELLQRRIHLVDVDLRWGVTSEQDALSVCREVVDECRPRFLCMLWVWGQWVVGLGSGLAIGMSGGRMGARQGFSAVSMKARSAT